MNWTHQAQDMMTTWLEAQKKLWDGWAGLATKTTPVSPWNTDEWRARMEKTAREGLDALLSGMGKVPREVAGRALNGEEVYLRFVDTTLSMFQQMAPGMEAGQDWVKLLRGFVDRARSELEQGPAPWLSGEAASAMSRDLPELLKLYAAQWRNMGTPFLDSLKEARGHVGQAMSGDRKASIKMFNLFLDTFESSVGKFAAAPAIGYSREFQERLMKACETWFDVRRAEVAFQTELVNTGLRAFDTLIHELAAKAEKGEKIESFRELFDLWIATAEKAYFAAASTEEFAEVQADLVNAAMHYRIHERGVAEEFLAALQLPTRRELDDTYRGMNQLRRQVKELRKELTRLRAEQAATVAQPAPPAPRRPPARPKAKAQGSAPKKSAAKQPKEG